VLPYLYFRKNHANFVFCACFAHDYYSALLVKKILRARKFEGSLRRIFLVPIIAQMPIPAHLVPNAAHLEGAVSSKP
jgi:hypothetical protein